MPTTHDAFGFNLREHCEALNINYDSARQLLCGKASGCRGETHRAAVLLGLKPDPSSIQPNAMQKKPATPQVIPADLAEARAMLHRAIDEFPLSADDLRFILTLTTMAWGTPPAALYAQLRSCAQDADCSPAQPATPAGSPA